MSWYPQPAASKGNNISSLPEKLDRMAASKFISDAAIQFKLGRLATEFELVRDSLGGVRLSLNWMAASNINSDAAIRARFSGSAGDDFIAEAINQVALNHDTAEASASSVPGP
ncbi:hypothetical protein PCANC_11336 [Puccinia coronata f. sp. avenae]|uniref:Uncharacterized protein n=1 Tax=Puccinia coronata f. sp. avenae TaxID=200324 RepID=A0A2N5VT09_9BASI|nr:hypothetical protein PCANC_11336 [Puccinia coronata f. sp. avenae]